MSDGHSESEKEIWNLYVERCRQNGTKPTVEDFKAWLVRQMKEM